MRSLAAFTLVLSACTWRPLEPWESSTVSPGDLHATDQATSDLRRPDLREADPCAGLDEQACRTASDAGCVADYCTLCSCTPSFVGCRASTAPMTPCPVVECPRALCCRSNNDCLDFGFSCVPPGVVPSSCGICARDPGGCTDDSQCKAQGERFICDQGASPDGCFCGPRCAPGCLGDDDCKEGERCDAQHHCRTRHCAEGCPLNFDCIGDLCARRTCASDAVCQGACVLGACYAGQGICLPPPPP